MPDPGSALLVAKGYTSPTIHVGSPDSKVATRHGLQTHASQKREEGHLAGPLNGDGHDLKGAFEDQKCALPTSQARKIAELHGQRGDLGCGGGRVPLG